MVQTLYKIVDQDITTSHYKRSGRRYVLKVRDLPEDEKTREKLNMLGPSSLSISELVAILLGTGTRKEEVMSMADRILKEHGAAAIIIAHNHPSGDTDPTSEDISVTEQLVDGGKILGIEVLDHLVITSKAYLSIINKSKI